ncbi:helix-turn-helix transcriptional regulator, partial [Oceanospirillum sp. HFRX-1_2]
YRATHLIDEVSIIVNIKPDVQLHLSLGLRDSRRVLTPEDISRLEVVTPLLIALTRSHWPDVSGETSRVGAHMENAFNQFGTSKLSERESEIARLTLQGHSSKSMARLLDISPETVKVYRKKVHQKLAISSQGELFSIFLEALKNMPVGAQGDPLAFVGITENRV